MNNLRTHLYYHAEPKFLCTAEGCGKKFFMRKLLKAHMNVSFLKSKMRLLDDKFVSIGSSRKKRFCLQVLREELLFSISFKASHCQRSFEAQN